MNRFSNPGYIDNEEECKPFSVLPTAGWSTISPTPGEIGKNYQLFSFWDPAIYIPENTFRVSLFQKSLQTNGGQLWEIVTNSLEFRNISGDPVTPSTKDQIINNPNLSRYSIYTARVTIRDGSAYGHVLDYDIGGGCVLEAFGQSVTVEILGPPNTSVINTATFSPNNIANLPTAPADNIVVNGIVTGAVNPPSVPRGVNSLPLKLTRYTQVLATATNFVAIPAGAREVEVKQTTLAPATTNVNFIARDNAAFPVVGVIPLVNNASARVLIPNAAQFIDTGPPNADTTRRFTYIFVLNS